MDGSKDGLHWEAGEVLQVSDEEAGVIQPTLWQSSGADVHALLRSDTGHVYRADSADGGKTWGPARRSGLPNNNSGLDVARLADGTLVLAYNPTAGEWAARYPLRLAISEVWALIFSWSSGAKRILHDDKPPRTECPVGIAAVFLHVVAEELAVLHVAG